MALVACRECGLGVSRGTLECPHCGATEPGMSRVEQVLAAIVAIGALLAVLLGLWRQT